MKIISFSAWGDKEKYLKGCLENIDLAKEVYPGWDTRFYCDSKMNPDFISKLERKGAQIVVMETVNNNWEGLFWRFLPASEGDVEMFISRDIDSRLNVREKVAVDEWLSSDKDFHCMRDHLEHNVPILGGMWGCRNYLIKDMEEMISNWKSNNYKGSDQDFLKQIVWCRVRTQTIAHDKYYNGIVIEQPVHNVESYKKQLQDFEDFKNATIVERGRFICELRNAGFDSDSIESQVRERFPELRSPPQIRLNPDGQAVVDYYYHPIDYFGYHDVRPFPSHPPLKYGVHVGEIIE
jgi:hypothetical protein